MTVYVDLIATYPTEIIAAPARRHGQRWCHMWADTREELDAMADRIGLSRRHIQDASNRHLRHYDLVPSKRALAVRAGAVEMSLREYLDNTRPSV